VKTMLTCLLGLVMAAGHASAQDEEDLAKKLANPVASLISLPIQANYDQNIGVDEEGSVWRTNIQPVIPFSLGESWNLISRTILPVVAQSDIPSRALGESGIGDVVQSLFFSPKEPAGGWVWGAGPALLLPTASKDVLGADQWGVGPTAVALRQKGPWTIGGLVNHIESVAGGDEGAAISATFVQPFLTYITKTKTSLSLTTESTYDWENEAWSVPIIFNVQQLLKVGSQILQLGAGVRYWAESPEGGPQEWGARVQLTLLFPK
jgi:hypothetical protein